MFVRRYKFICFALILAACRGSPASTSTQGLPTYTNKHAHNDYEHPRPLFDALDLGYESVEADVWWSGSDIIVSHQGLIPKGSLESLYLKPLADRVAAHGYVQAPNQPFYLWIDLKHDTPELREGLPKLLARYPIFTLFDEKGRVAQRAVTVILTGMDSIKIAMVDAKATVLPFTRDGSALDAKDPQANGRWRSYAVRWPIPGWEGHGEITPESRAQLEELVTQAHQKGRMIRFWKAPDTEESWKLQRDLKVDFIGADDLAGLKGTVQKIDL